MKKLRIDYLSNDVHDGFEILHFLLEELRLNLHRFLIFNIPTGHWQHLKRLDIVGWTYGQFFLILNDITETVEKGDLPALEIVCFLTRDKTGSKCYNNSDFYSRLRKKDVDVFVIDADLEMIVNDAGLNSIY